MKRPLLSCDSTKQHPSNNRGCFEADIWSIWQAPHSFYLWAQVNIVHEDTLLAYQLSTKTEQGIVSSHKDGELEKTHSVHLLAMKILSWSWFATVNLETESRYVHWIPFSFYSFTHTFTTSGY